MEAKKIITNFYKEAVQQTWKGKCIAGLEFTISITLALLVLVWVLVTYGSDNPISLDSTQIRYLCITFSIVSLFCFLIGYAHGEIWFFIPYYKKFLSKQDVMKYKKLKKERLETLIKRNNRLHEKLKDKTGRLEREERLLNEFAIA